MKNFLLFAFSLISMAASAQTHVSASGQLGWIIPGGSGVNSTNYDVAGGLDYAVDALYHLGGEEGKLAVGVNYHSAILSGGLFDNYGLQVAGLKGLYQLNPGGFTPFVGLTLGLARLSTPEISVNGTVTSPANTATGLGLVPQLGLMFGGGFYLSADYILPTNFDIEEIGTTGSVGGIVISLGYRRPFSF